MSVLRFCRCVHDESDCGVEGADLVLVVEALWHNAEIDGGYKSAVLAGLVEFLDHRVSHLFSGRTSRDVRWLSHAMGMEDKITAETHMVESWTIVNGQCSRLRLPCA